MSSVVMFLHVCSHRTHVQNGACVCTAMLPHMCAYPTSTFFPSLGGSSIQALRVVEKIIQALPHLLST